jgi:Flp pilus assembly protein TadG
MRTRLRWICRMWTQLRSQSSGDAGSSTAELAVATPLLVMVLLFAVLCARLASTQMDLQAAAGSGARSASIARTQTAARADAERAARDTLAARGLTCRDAAVSVEPGALRPGGAATVTVSCTVPFSDLLLLGVPGSRTVSATATSPIDRYRGVSLGFATGEVALGVGGPR